jgi:hypothetical protein
MVYSYKLTTLDISFRQTSSLQCRLNNWPSLWIDIYCHVFEMRLSRRFGLVIGFIEHLQLVIISNYSAIANLHTLQITRAQAKPQSAFTVRFRVTDLNNGNSSASVLTSLLSGEYPTTELLLQLTNSEAGGHLTPTSYSSLHRLTYNWQQLDWCPRYITPWHGHRIKHSFQHCWVWIRCRGNLFLSRVANQ